MNIITKAARYAKRAHTGQFRKYNGTPYWLHPARVAGLVSAFTDDERVIAVAWLHDVIEDTDLTYMNIDLDFGEFIATRVQVLTKLKPQEFNRDQRNAAYNRQLRWSQHVWNVTRPGEIAPTTLVKLADRYDNLREMDYELDFFPRYVNETHDLLDALNVEHELVDLIRAWGGPRREM